MLTVTNVSKQFNKHTVIKNVSFTLQKGRCTALIGPNGSGKTTILRMLTGLIRPSNGTILYDYPHDFRRAIGYLPQYPKFHEWMTGKEFLTYCGKLYGYKTDETKNKVAQLLEEVGLTEAENKRISKYSGGMKQRLGIAQALIHQPEILFLDEPVSSLDPLGRRDVLTLMKRLKKDMTILFSTHILNDADEVSDSLILLKGGEIVEQGTISSLAEKYTTEKIIVQFASEREEITAELKLLPSVIDIETIGNNLHLYVTDITKAQNELFSFIQRNNLTLAEYRMGRLTMEEMFVKVVK